MKKKSAKTTKKVARVSKSVKATGHGPMCSCAKCQATYSDMWGKDRGLVLVLAAGIVILVVAGMYIVGWL